MQDNFQRSLEFVLAHEGGEKVTKNPHDPGGTTKWGISQRAYPHLDIESLTREQAEGIYYADYWHKAGCDDIPWPMDCILFDTAVNLGVSGALKILDGSDSPVSFLFRRARKYVSLKKPMFLGGWINRVIDLYEFTRQA